MKKIHGTFNSIEALREAAGWKPSAKKQVRKCEKCGQPMRNIEGTNVWMCDFASLTDEKVGEKDIQVFTRCKNTEFAETRVSL